MSMSGAAGQAAGGYALFLQQQQQELQQQQLRQQQSYLSSASGLAAGRNGSSGFGNTGSCAHPATMRQPAQLQSATHESGSGSLSPAVFRQAGSAGYGSGSASYSQTTSSGTTVIGVQQRSLSGSNVGAQSISCQPFQNMFTVGSRNYLGELIIPLDS